MRVRSSALLGAVCMGRRPGGIVQPMSYDREPLIAEICERLAEGEPLRVICRDPHMPAWRTVYLWASDDQAVAARIAQARATGFDAIAEECLEIADDASGDMKPVGLLGDMGEGTPKAFDAEHVQRSKLRIETRLKLLAKWDPKRYGDKQAIEHSVSEDTAAILAAARKRAGGG